MTARTVVTGLLVTSLAVSARPAWAENTTSSSFRASVDRAAAAAVAMPQGRTAPGTKRLVDSARPAEYAQAVPGGGGGGGMRVMSIVMTLVGTAAGVGATYYMLKELKKTANSVK